MVKVNLRIINDCTLAQQKAVRLVRNQLSVRRSMYTDHEIALDEHLAWIKRLVSDDKQIVFVVIVEGKVSGVVSVNALDRLHRRSDWAFYLGENVRGGLGAALEYNLLNFVFDKLELEKLNCEIIETNTAVVKMHKKFGFIEEGFRRSNIEKNGKRFGVHFLGLTKSEWISNRGVVYEKYQNIIGKFALSVEYNPE